MVKRYDKFCDESGIHEDIYEDDDGDYVKYDDYQELLAKYNQLVSDVEYLWKNT